MRRIALTAATVLSLASLVVPTGQGLSRWVYASQLDANCYSNNQNYDCLTGQPFQYYLSKNSSAGADLTSTGLSAYEPPAHNQYLHGGSGYNSCAAWAAEEVHYVISAEYANDTEWPGFAPMYTFSVDKSWDSQLAGWVSSPLDQLSMFQIWGTEPISQYSDLNSDPGDTSNVGENEGGFTSEGARDDALYNYTNEPPFTHSWKTSGTGWVKNNDAYGGTDYAHAPFVLAVRMLIENGQPVVLAGESNSWDIGPLLNHAVMAYGYDSTGVWIENSANYNGGNVGNEHLSYQYVEMHVDDAMYGWWNYEGIDADVMAQAGNVGGQSPSNLPTEL